MTAVPGVCGVLGPTVRRILPLLLPTERRQVQVGPVAAEMLNAPILGVIRPPDRCAVSEEHADPVVLETVHGCAHVLVELGADRRVPGQVPTHPPPILLELVEFGPRRQHKRHVSGVEVRRVAHCVDDPGTPVTARVLIGTKHEVVHDQLPPTAEEIEQRPGSILADELVVGPDRRHGQPAPLGVEYVELTGEGLLLPPQLGELTAPLGQRDLSRSCILGHRANLDRPPRGPQSQSTRSRRAGQDV